MRGGGPRIIHFPTRRQPSATTKQRINLIPPPDWRALHGRQRLLILDTKGDDQLVLPGAVVLNRARDCLKWQPERAPTLVYRPNSGELVDPELLDALGLHAGCRISETANLVLSDVVMTERKGHLVIRRSKGGKYRQVPINRTLRHSLEDYLKVRSKVGDDDLLISERRQGMDTDTIHGWIKRMADLAKIEDISYHCLRHTFATLQDQKGVRPNVIAKFMGHKSVTTTQRYLKARWDEVEQAVEKLED